ncbi:MAG: amidase [Mycobacteriales bacterium]
MTRVHAFTDDELGELDAVGVSAAIRSGELGGRQVLEAAIARIERLEPALHGLAHGCFDRARSAHPAAGAFRGVPALIKDNIDVRGLPTAHGSVAFAPRPARFTAPPAWQLLAQGFALLGKSTLPEFGLTASTEYAARPATRNPWDTSRSAGGSSGGSAALVAAGAVPLAHGNDGGGSIRIPAAATGLVGLKVTRRRLLDQAGVRRLPINLVSEGVLTRTVRDTAHYLAAAERLWSAPGLEPVGLIEGPGAARRRIGVLRTDVRGRPIHPEVDAVVRAAGETLAGLGHQVGELRRRPEPGLIADFALYWALLAVLTAGRLAAGHPRGFRPRELDPFTRGLIGHARRNRSALPAAIGRLRHRDHLASFPGVDVVLGPVVTAPIPPLGEQRPDQPFERLLHKLIDFVGYTPLDNIGGGPALALPHGMSAGGLPGSVQLSAPPGGERTLLELGYEIEAARPFPRIADAHGSSTTS